MESLHAQHLKRNKSMRSQFIVGIDPGVKTGLAIWHRIKAELVAVETLPILKALGRVSELIAAEGKIELVFEDARQRKYFGSSGREKLQGAGSIKRDCSIWQEFCEMHGIPFTAIRPQAGSTKWKADRFKRVTKWEGRTSEHSRDAALLVFGSK